MAYDALTESVRLIESGHLQPVLRLSRRRRFAAMAVDVADDVAVTMFARRSVGCALYETHVLARRAGQWHLLGGGGGTAPENPLGHRPAELPTGLGWWQGTGPGIDPRLVALEGTAGTLDTRGGSGRWPWRNRWINSATVLVNADVAMVATSDRQLAVPWHGHVVVAWKGRRPQELAILDRAGHRLGEVTLPPSR